MYREPRLTRAEAAPVAYGERRRQERSPASGSVQLLVQDPAVAVVSGSLIDISRSGFRAAHSHSGLEKGQIVRFRHHAGEGFARVVWNHISEGEVQTGFLIL